MVGVGSKYETMKKDGIKTASETLKKFVDKYKTGNFKEIGGPASLYK